MFKGFVLDPGDSGSLEHFTEGSSKIKSGFADHSCVWDWRAEGEMEFK